MEIGKGEKVDVEKPGTRWEWRRTLVQVRVFCFWNRRLQNPDLAPSSVLSLASMPRHSYFFIRVLFIYYYLCCSPFRHTVSCQHQLLFCVHRMLSVFSVIIFLLSSPSALPSFLVLLQFFSLLPLPRPPFILSNNKKTR